MNYKFGLFVLTATLLMFGAGAEAKNQATKGYDQARKECLEKDKSLRGKKLQLCIKKKRAE